MREMKTQRTITNPGINVGAATSLQQESVALASGTVIA